MKYLIVTICIAVIAITAAAQTEVNISSHTFNTGVHSTFSVLFENVDDNVLEAYWKKKLKDISEDISTKKHLTATGTLIPSIHHDTIAVFAKVDRPKKSPHSTLHIAFRVNNGILGTGSGDEEDARVQAAKDFVRLHSVQLKRELAQAELDDATKTLSRLEKALEGLVREKERAEKSIEKNLDKGKDAKRDRTKAESELDGLASRIKTKQAEVTADPSKANMEALNKLREDRDKAENDRDKADKSFASTEKKIKDLEYAIEKNIEDQANTSAQIEKQRELVQLLTQKLADIN